MEKQALVSNHGLLRHDLNILGRDNTTGQINRTKKEEKRATYGPFMRYENIIVMVLTLFHLVLVGVVALQLWSHFAANHLNILLGFKGAMMTSSHQWVT